jgi:hypothetical protein
LPNLGGSSVRSKQTAKSLGRFDLCTGVGRMLERNDQFVFQSLVIALSVQAKAGGIE